MESQKCGSIFSLGTLDKLKTIAYNNANHNLVLSKDGNHNFIFCLYGYNSGGIISIIAFTKSVRQIVDKVVVTYEKGIFYGAVLARGRHLFY